MASENSQWRDGDMQTMTRLFDGNSTVTMEAMTEDRDKLRTEFIIVGSILTVVFAILLISLAAFALYVRRRRPSLPTSPCPPSPPESVRAARAFRVMEEENSIYEPIGNFSNIGLSKAASEETFTEIL